MAAAVTVFLALRDQLCNLKITLVRNSMSTIDTDIQITAILYSIKRNNTRTYAWMALEIIKYILNTVGERC